MRLDLASGHATGVERDHVAVEAFQAALALGHDLGLEGALAVTGHAHRQRAGVGEDLLLCSPIAGVAGASAFGGVFLVAEMSAHLSFESTLDEPGRELLEDPSRISEGSPAWARSWSMSLGSMDMVSWRCG